MAGLAHGTSRLAVLEPGFSGAVGRMSRMAPRASSIIDRDSLPAHQLLVPVIGASLLLPSPAFVHNRHRLLGLLASPGHILVAF
jgi:hypothetical protein